jgi:hypothetical protein
MSDYEIQLEKRIKEMENSLEEIIKENNRLKNGIYDKIPFKLDCNGYKLLNMIMMKPRARLGAPDGSGGIFYVLLEKEFTDEETTGMFWWRKTKENKVTKKFELEIDFNTDGSCSSMFDRIVNINDFDCDYFDKNEIDNVLAVLVRKMRAMNYIEVIDVVSNAKNTTYKTYYKLTDLWKSL